jgi:uncharacterized protein with FMN-binding domain
MKIEMKNWLRLVQLTPSLAIALVATLGFQMSAPVLEEIIWPEKPEVSVTEVAPKKDKEAEAEELVIQGVGNFEDGTYYGSGTGFGGTTRVEVVVENRQITAVNVLSHQDDESFFSRARAVISSILTAQTWEVDSVSGATYSSRGIMEAVRNALTGETSETEPAADNLAQPETLSVSSFDDSAEWMDGSYTGSARGFGGTITVKVTIQGGKITSIQVTNHSGETASYYNKAKAIISRILKAQSPNVDTVSGATYSSSGIREAVKIALKKAAGKSVSETPVKADDDQSSGDDTGEEIVLPEGAPADGTYVGTGECERFDYSVQLTAKFERGELQALWNFTVLDNDDPDNVSFYEKAWAGMKSRLLANTDAQVDTVSGATYSSRAILEAYQDAYRQAVEAGGGEVETPAPEEPTQPEEPEQPNEPETPDEGEETTPLPAGTPADGTYTVSALCEPDEDGEFSAYSLSADLTFADGKLVSIERLNSTDTSNKTYYNKAANGTSKKPGVISQLIDKQSSEDIDLISGATCSSKSLVAIYEEAYRQAVEAGGGEVETPEEPDVPSEPETPEEPEQPSEPETPEEPEQPSEPETPEEPEQPSEPEEKDTVLKDGTYTGTAVCEPDEDEEFSAYTMTADVTFENDELVSIERITATGDSSKNKTYYNKAANGTSKKPGIIKQLLSKQNSDVDTISGATCSSKALIAIYEDAKAQAKKAKENEK